MALFAGSNSNDILIGSNTDDTMFGHGNHDRLIGRGGDDFIDGGAGRDFLEGQEGNDTLDGGADVDELYGGAGNDQLVARDDGDRLEGGVGDDRYVMLSTSSNVTMVEAPGGGTDTVAQFTSSFILPDHVENLENFGALGIGNALDNTMSVGGTSARQLQGLDGNDRLIGADGDDHLEGGTGGDRIEGGKGNDLIDGGAGDDQMFGGEGNDTYIVSSALDFILDLDPGVDRVVAGLSYTLGNGVENLTLAADAAEATDATGNALNNEIVGNAAANVLRGLDGNDRLLGGLGDDALEGGSGNDELRGGAGNDAMKGGSGDDLYFVSDAGDQVIEFANEGLDRVDSTINFTLPDNVESLVLNGGSVGIGNDRGNTIGTRADASILLGLGGRDEIHGGAGNDILDGGTEDDIMNGNEGDDLYIVDDVLDVIHEHGVGDIDTVQSSVSYGLSADLEILQLTGTGDIAGTGNALNNTVTGNVGSNALNGGAGNDTLRGGAGDDTLIGGTGNDTLDGGVGTDVMRGNAGADTYFVDNTQDVIEENVGEGSDTVNSSASYALSANIESLALMGAAALVATGNALNNTLQGNNGQNILRGEDGDDTLGGGSGADVLLGGAGNDSFVFDALDLTIAGTRYDGGAGTDTLLVRGGAQSLDLTSLADERAIGIEIVDLTGSGNNTLVFSASDLKALSDTDTLRIDGNAGDIASMVDAGWTPGADLSFGQNLYHSFFNAGATLLIDSDVTAAFA